MQLIRQTYFRLMVLAMIASLTSASNITIQAYSGVGLPIQNITVLFSDELAYSYTNYSDVEGALTAYDITGGNITIRLDYPSSAYSARIDYINGTQTVFLNNVYGATLRLVNTLGQPLEAQDCSVAIFDNESNQLVARYDTQCRQGEKYIDSLGNWASLTNCPMTDSFGNYYFSTKILENDGFEYGRYYRTEITCNAQTGKTTFYVDVSKPTDIGMWFDWARRYGGIILVYLAILIGIIILLYLIKCGVG